jgi:hypothetical protein
MRTDIPGCPVWGIDDMTSERLTERWLGFVFGACALLRSVLHLAPPGDRMGVEQKGFAARLLFASELMVIRFRKASPEQTGARYHVVPIR